MALTAMVASLNPAINPRQNTGSDSEEVSELQPSQVPVELIALISLVASKVPAWPLTNAHNNCATLSAPYLIGKSADSNA